MRPPERLRALCVAGATTLLALLAQLGYDVIAPDDLGLGVSSARHQVRCAMPAPIHREYGIHPTNLDARFTPSLARRT